MFTFCLLKLTVVNSWKSNSVYNTHPKLHDMILGKNCVLCPRFYGNRFSFVSRCNTDKSWWENPSTPTGISWKKHPDRRPHTQMDGRTTRKHNTSGTTYGGIKTPPKKAFTQYRHNRHNGQVKTQTSALITGELPSISQQSSYGVCERDAQKTATQ